MTYASLCKWGAVVDFPVPVMDHRVDAFVDNMALVSAWHGQGGRNSQLTDVIKEFFQVTMVSNIDLKITYVPAADNAADGVCPFCG